jgi:hypothetical protein
MQEVVATAPLVRPTPDDLEAFAREHPVAAVQADKLTAVGRMSGAAGLAGAITGGAHSWKHNRMVAYLGIGAILGGMTATLVADDVRIRIASELSNTRAPRGFVLWRCPCAD